MKCLFLTRCYKTTNLKRIQENIRDVFRGSVHQYKHAILFDSTIYKKLDFPRDIFNCDTNLYICYKKDKNDAYMTEFIDYTLERYAPLRKDVYVYVLDDDNLIMPEFLSVLDETKDEHAVVFKVDGHPEWGTDRIKPGHAVGKIDWSNFITRIDVMKNHKVFHRMTDSQKADGIFFNNLLTLGMNIKFIDRVCGCYNALPKP